MLASGSTGNSVLVEADGRRLLIDAGLSARELARRLAQLEVDPATLNAVLVTHEHDDHVRGLVPFSKRYGVPVYLHRRLEAQLDRKPALVRVFDEDELLVVDTLRIAPCPLTHDAVAPVGFVVESSEGKVGLATDLGLATRLVADRLQECRVLILESNHDEIMLRDGPYPWHLKQRIKSRHGHLSNSESAQLLEQLRWKGLEAVFLAHLSQKNNTPDLAISAASRALEGADHPQLLVGSPNEVRSWESDGKDPIL